ncbi:steroid 17-alpha-hydroxylase/17,20 lyase-like isoform X2 [Orbicella faveolata]|uniref:steroid 17-alpha-hydroxylase/17,20 lyase-like isoform X2 n=1 Tax=Orbicella faveolata TaxID=48498 RepID=UPI0009E25805|nr:steroid 17-alpha-hydroxylase/17,20 lyase-like isoform X2 [Orbicella faveolata]
MEMLEYCTLGNLFLAVIFLLILNQLIELYQFRNMPPGSRLTSLPLTGNLLSFDSGDSLREITASLRKKYGTVYSMKVGSFKLVVAEDADSVKEVLVKRSADYAGRPPFHSFQLASLGGKDIIIGNYGPAWKFHRKLFMAAIRQYLSDQQLVEERIFEQAGRLLQYFEDQNGKDFDPACILMESVANVIGRITFGKYFDSSHPDFEELLQLNIKGFTDTKTNTQNFVLDFFPAAKYFPFPSYQSVQKLMGRIFEILRHQLKIQENDFDPTAKIDSLTGSLLKERIAAENEVGSEDKASILSDESVINTMEDMFGAGYETTSTTLRWAIAYLVHHPHCQTEIQNQLDEVVGRDRMPGLGDRPHLPLLQATIMEALRLGNVAEAALPHYTMKDTSLAGYRVPKDTVVLVHLMNVHLDPNFWENPNSFNPHRHIDADGQLITNSGNFLPFSAGRRVCAGEALAKVTLENHVLVNV